MIWEEEGHHIFHNLENKYKYTFSSSLAPHETLIWFCCFSSPKNSASKLYNTRGRPPGKRCGQRESRFLQHNNAKIQVPSHGTPYLYLYGKGRVRGEDKVVTTEGVSCITTQTNSKGVFLCFNVKKHIRDYGGGQPTNDPQVSVRETHEYIHSRHAKLETRESFVTLPYGESRIHKKHILRVFLGIFRLWCLLESFS